MGLLFLHGMAQATWFVPLGTVLDSSGLGQIKSLAFATSAVAALLSPLFFGALADRIAAPAKVLRWISLITAILVAWIAWNIHTKSNPWVVLSWILLQSIFLVPTNSLTGSIVFYRLVYANKGHFGAIRAMGTIGWMSGCWLTSWMEFDASPSCFYLTALLWLLLCGYACTMKTPSQSTPQTRTLSLRERFGFDAIQLLRIHDHRIVFLTSALIAIPFAAFYPYTPAHLAIHGYERLSAWMSLGQVTEVIAMFTIAGLLARWNLKPVLILGLVCGLLRYLLYAIDAPIPLLLGLTLHGFAFTYTYISIQIYLAERIQADWQARAQALLSLITGGVGNLVGYMLTGWWFELCRDSSNTQSIAWTRYWIGLDVIVLFVLVYFSIGYWGKTKNAVNADT